MQTERAWRVSMCIMGVAIATLVVLRKGEYFIHKGERVYLRECHPTRTYDCTVVYCWLNHVGMYFETIVVGDYCETYWVFKK